jgi:diaminohydroxyphosphoribosylaminopyrimidine deaminase/5-amino-6-(5-phosphoribosylamino)uracil reductase
MRRALRLARRGWGQTAPNPMVGAVVVHDGEVVGEGWHRRWGGPHAEVEALRAAGERAHGATAYVTLEPCSHWGKTPPCTQALLAAGVRRVVHAVDDPNPVARGGAALLAAAGVEVVTGVERGAARELLAPFLNALTADRPWVSLKLALSLDGALADHTRGPGWLTGAAARRAVHHLRAGADAVAVGIGTALADDPALTVRGVPAPRVAPLRVVFDRHLRLPVDGQLARTAREVTVVVVCEPTPDPALARALETAGVRLVLARSAAEALALLRRDHDVRHLFVEGGARLAGSLWADDLVDRLIIFRAPVVLGGGAVHAFDGWTGVRVGEARRLPAIARRTLGDDRMTVFAVHPIPGGEPARPTLPDPTSSPSSVHRTD